ncbi:MAG TPA: hypothetical protein VJB89_03480 [Candidatus Nanoarchaeia archaeon]|nr:hypothetical protein [Candidatus Nanoarchaeia archaeon]
MTIDEKLPRVKEIWVDNFTRELEKNNLRDLRLVSGENRIGYVYASKNYFYFRPGGFQGNKFHFFREDQKWNIRDIDDYFEEKWEGYNFRPKGEFQKYNSSFSHVYFNKNGVVVIYDESGKSTRDLRPIIKIKKELIE